MTGSTQPVYGFSLRSTWLKHNGGAEFVSELAQMGFGAAEIMPDAALDAGFTLDEIVDVIHESGMIAGFHAPYAAGVLLADAEDSQIREAQRGYLPTFDAAIHAAQGQESACIINLHGASAPIDPTRRKDLYYRTWNLLRWIAQLAEGSGQDVMIALELLPYSERRMRIGERHEELVRLVSSPSSQRLGISWDMGHDWATQRRQANPGPPGDDFLHRVIHTHIHDLDSQGRDHAPLIYGSVPLQEYINLLKSAGYKGIWLLELDPARVGEVGDPLPVIAGSLNTLRKQVEGI